jgi:hypothetical protein
VRENDDGSITFAASLPPLQSAISLDGNGDGARVKLDIPREDRLAAFYLQDWAEIELEVTVKPRNERDGSESRKIHI